MATYKQIGYGSQGSDVTELQKLLNNNGYSLNVDGIFGAKTQSAVKDYQQKNNLAVDGIVGTNTWGALTKATATQPETGTTNTTAPATQSFSYDPFKASDSTLAADKNRQELASQKPGDFSYGEYQKSDAVKQAEALLQQQLSQKPGAYQSQWQASLDDTLNKILNREKFSYDLNEDALYQQYKDQYMLQGQQAMMNTMGQAQAMTGGYANSYAQTVGQQTYQGYLQQLNDVVPELYQLALDQYNREGDDLYNQYGLYADRENLDYGRYRDQVSDYYAELDRLTEDSRYQSETDYGRYRDQVSDYYTELDRLTEDSRYQSETDYNRYMDKYSKEYGEYRDSVSDWQQAQDRADAEYWAQYEKDYGQYSDERNLAYDNYWNEQNLAYQQDRDKVADEQWQAEFNEAKRQYDEQMALKTGSSSGVSSGGSSSGNTSSSNGSGGGYNNGNRSSSQVKDMQRALGVTPDGIWGPASQAAAKSKWGTSSADSAWTYYTGKVRVPGGTGSSNNSSSSTTYSNWSAGTWEAYFAKIRQTEGKAAAIEELNYFTTNGLIPKNMVTYASSGARGGQMGH